MPDSDQMLSKVRRRLSKLRPARAGTETVDVAACVTPLRYDVLVRARFFDFLAARQGMPADELSREAQHEPYFVWFEHIECARFFPELLASREALVARFASRVQGAVRLLRSFEDSGFDPRWPVTLMSVREGSLADSGAPVMRRLHIGDGCHRIALLLRAGQALEPAMYRIRATSQPVPDNTAVLRRQLPIPDADYARFVAGAFDVDTAVEDVQDVEALRARVALGSPDRLHLLDRVLTAQHAR